MTTMHHPTIPGVTYEVRDSQVESWSEQGWTKSKSKAVREAKVPDAPKDPAQATAPAPEAPAGR